MSFAEAICDPITGTSIRFSDVIDSRCPKDVYCIWAGEVRIKFDIMNDEEVINSFTIGVGAPLEFEVNQQLFVFTLKAVTPDPPPGDVKKSTYKITLEVAQK
ncbi:hypothetical protein KK083_02570 [Fulvivirgaceae bacterium PWU4]|uniref:Uncharacterized protein n=1 Tax=Chryseosolibacter histidini TaxID=2782349 RepID=A0AAP2DKV6_9BACT|nr:hypothetical protein [Chryseosolibacter histidini]MBT1695744.1 hypothetical protein [Chryseosolibacter histidini]